MHSKKVLIKTLFYVDFLSNLFPKLNNVLSIWYITDFSDDEGEETEKDNEDPEEWGKFLHLKERVGLIFCLDWKVWK